jgi:hypothetical protein
MSSLSMADRLIVEKHFGMASGYVLNFSDRTFGEFVFEAVGRQIHDVKYTKGGTSKANKLRTFWKIESESMVGKLILALVDYEAALYPVPDAEAKARSGKCRHIATRLMTGGPSCSPSKGDANIPHPDEVTKTQSPINAETLAALRTRFLQISTLLAQQRGYALEKFLFDLFEAHRFNPRPSFRIVGEQIDGSIEFEHEIYLIEAKWTNQPIVQGDLAVLSSRVSGHSQIGRGIFITAGCFSPDGIAAHERLRPAPMIGIDGQDLYYLLEHSLPLAEIIRRKLRWLVETGRFHHPVRDFVMELETQRLAPTQKARWSSSPPSGCSLSLSWP